MDEQQNNLIAQVTQEVLKRLGAPVDIRPPIGVCTGDYAQFTDRPDLLTSSPSTPPKPTPERSEGSGQASPHTASPIASPVTSPVTSPIALTGIITASQLQAAMQAASDGVATIAHDARLSPLAADLAREKPDKVRRVQIITPAKGATSGVTWNWWIDGTCPVVQKVTTLHGGKLARVTGSTVGGVVLDVARAIKAKRIVGGVIFTPQTALAAALANRCATLRAVVGEKVETVRDAIAQLGVNVLIVNHSRVSESALTAMLEDVLARRPEVSPLLARQLKQMQQEG